MPAGFLLLNKPPGPSSARALSTAAKGLGKPKIGHAGTLDPFAEGLLVAGIGPATRLLGRVMDFPKTYEATFRLGLSTDSMDITGVVLEQQAPHPLNARQIEEAAALLLNQTEQVPPMHSALKRDGKALYELAREGKTVDRAPRPVTVYTAAPIGATEDTVSFSLTVSRGTYIRSFCTPLSLHFQQPVVLEKLVRTQSGPFSLSQAVTPDRVTPQTPLLPMATVVEGLHKVYVEAHGLQKILKGQKLGPHDLSGGTIPPEGMETAVFHGCLLVGLGLSLSHGIHVDRVLVHESP